MTQNYSVKRALVASVLSIALCFSMLVGTTFAWFTDSVASANNIITAGNLDVEMYWADGTKAVPADDAADWADASSVAIFDYSLWEPGFAMVRHVKIANEGSLALKYKVNFVANGEVTDLANVIDVYYVDPAVQIADSDELTADMKIGTLREVLNNLGTTGYGTLKADTSDTVTIALKMQDSAGNEYMDKYIGTSFSIQVLATQLSHESDSFDNLFDSGSTYPEVSTTEVKEPLTVEKDMTVGNATITLPIGTEPGEYEAVISNVENALDESGNDVISFHLDLTKDGVKVESESGVFYEVAYFIGLNRNLSKILHKGEPVQNPVYDPATGYVYFTVSDFSPFEIISYTSLITKASELVDNLAKGGTFVLANDIDLADIDWTPAGNAEAPFKGTFDGNGYTISNLTVKNHDYASFISHADASSIIRNVYFENLSLTSTKHAAGVVCVAAEGITIENVIVSGEIEAPSYAGGILHNAANAVLKSCVNFATINATRAAGIASWVTSNASIQDCVNYGTVYGSAGASGIAHGFAGSVKNCVNYGKITSDGIEPAAGIAGVQKAASTYEYCTNYGAVTSTPDNANSSAAGILGQTPGSSATFAYCANHGKITAVQSYAAGIGYSLYGTVKASYCYNDGAIYGADGAGAIAPKAQYGAGDTASYCLNAGTVSSEGTVYLGSDVNKTSYDISTGTLAEIGKTSAVALEDALAVLNGGADADFFAINGNTIAPKSASTVLVSTADELKTALIAKKNIVFANDITFNEKWDNRYQGTKTFYDVVIDGAGHTLKLTGAIDDSNNYSVFRFEADATVKNLTFDLSEATTPNNRFRAISAMYNLTVDNCTFIGNTAYTNTRAIIFGEGQSSAQFNTSAVITNSSFINWTRGIIDNENAKDAKSFFIGGNTLVNAPIHISAHDNITITNNTIQNGHINIRSNSNSAVLKVTVTGNALDEATLSNSSTYIWAVVSNITAQDGIKIYAR